MKATPRQHRIVIERFTATQDEYGEEVQTWATYATCWAEVFYGSGREQREAAQEQASQIAQFEVLNNAKTRAVTPLDRVQFGGAVWDITAVHDLGRNEGVRITATRAA